MALALRPVFRSQFGPRRGSADYPQPLREGEEVAFLGLGLKRAAFSPWLTTSRSRGPPGRSAAWPTVSWGCPP
eukprot:13842493-Alexandrium_andersonii.AAC.1